MKKFLIIAATVVVVLVVLKFVKPMLPAGLQSFLP